MVNVTDGMRQAVYDADCERLGHIISIREAISNDPTVYPDENTIRVRAESLDAVPHLSCQRCGRVWLIIEEAGRGYAHAMELLCKRLRPDDELHDRTRELVPRPHDDHEHEREDAEHAEAARVAEHQDRPAS